ncbi:MAG: response regulator [Euryarchaeota archaeon]|nr:response regulator [Euryarchaeota archaeon]
MANKEYKPILLVEDNPTDVNLIVEAFQKNEMGHILDFVYDGIEAVEYLFGSVNGTSLCYPAPKLVLLDLRLPRMDGLEVLRRIRTHHEAKHLSVIVFTGSQDEQDHTEALNLNVDGYIQKPLDYHDFPKALEKIGLTWLILHQ